MDVISKTDKSARLAIIAIASSIVTASALLFSQYFSYNKLSKKEKARYIKEELLAKEDVSNSSLSIVEEISGPIDETLVRELLARNIAFLGEEGVEKVRQSKVIVFGVGAVGSWTSLMLVRSGLEHIRIIDHEHIKLESLSRHSSATLKDMGKSKVSVLKRHMAEIAPNAVVESIEDTLTKDNIEELLAGNPDYVVDTLSDIHSKVLLAQVCKMKNIKLVVSMSPGLKADPTQIQIADITCTMEDPLSRMYRRQLRKMNIDRDIPVVFSTEKSLNVDEVPYFNTRNLPSIGPITSMFGMAITTYIICQLARFEAYQLPSHKIRDGVYSRIQKDIMARELNTHGNKASELRLHEVGYIFDEIYKGKSAVSKTQDRMLVITRWNRSQPLSYINAVVMTNKEAKIHDNLHIDNHDYYSNDVIEYIERQLSLEKKIQELWSEQ
ncbi:hypothetical protein BDB01DRAFT_772875 [Pilobolus umbonatus]|nr:hypothetical protein BDB01DRAFT_772875 [Pilobolus umbonatus]